MFVPEHVIKVVGRKTVPLVCCSCPQWKQEPFFGQAYMFFEQLSVPPRPGKKGTERKSFKYLLSMWLPFFIHNVDLHDFHGGVIPFCFDYSTGLGPLSMTTKLAWLSVICWQLKLERARFPFGKALVFCHLFRRQAMILPVCCYEEASDPTLRKGAEKRRCETDTKRFPSSPMDCLDSTLWKGLDRYYRNLPNLCCQCCGGCCQCCCCCCCRCCCRGCGCCCWSDSGSGSSMQTSWCVKIRKKISGQRNRWKLPVGDCAKTAELRIRIPAEIPRRVPCLFDRCIWHLGISGAKQKGTAHNPGSGSSMILLDESNLFLQFKDVSVGECCHDWQQ